MRKLIGNTPIIKLKNLSNDSMADIYVKLEYYNLGGSVKTRVAHEMIKSAERNGVLHKGITLIEATGGNTGIGIAIISRLKGYNFIAVVPDNYSQQRIDLLKIYGAKVVLSNHLLGNDSHIRKAEEIVHANNTYFCLNQFNNRSCIDAHYLGTAIEIINSIDTVNGFVSVVGSAGTFTGISKRLKEYDSNTKCYVVQPEGSNIMTGYAKPHLIQGASVGIKPALLDYNLIDDIITVNNTDVANTLNVLCRHEGLFLGISSGANICAAIKIAKQMGPKKKIVTIAPDAGYYYFDYYSTYVMDHNI